MRAVNKINEILFRVVIAWNWVASELTLDTVYHLLNSVGLTAGPLRFVSYLCGMVVYAEGGNVHFGPSSGVHVNVNFVRQVVRAYVGLAMAFCTLFSHGD